MVTLLTKKNDFLIKKKIQWKKSRQKNIKNHLNYVLDLAIAKRLICVKLRQLLKSLRFASSFIWWFNFFPQPPAAKVIAKFRQLGNIDYGRFWCSWGRSIRVFFYFLMANGLKRIFWCDTLVLKWFLSSYHDSVLVCCNVGWFN